MRLNLLIVSCCIGVFNSWEAISKAVCITHQVAYNEYKKQQILQKNRNYLKLISSFFNGIKTWKAKFVEVGRNEGPYAGIFSLERRPTKLRMDYIDPDTREINIENGKVECYDKKLKERSVFSIHSSHLAFLLDYYIDLESNAEIISCDQVSNELSVVFRKKNDEQIESGIVRLLFKITKKNKKTGEIKDIAMKRWEIYKNIKDLNSKCPVVVVNLSDQFIKKISD